MKKILGISLCALFAVSAANADIASKLYVDGKVGAIDTSGIGENAAAITALQGRVTTSEGKITTLEGKVSTNEGAITGINNTIANMSQTQTTGQYVRYVKQENGDVTAEGGSFDTSVSDTSESTIAPTSKAVAAYVKGKVDGLGVTALEGRVTANANAISANTGNITTNTNSITAINNSMGGLEQRIEANEGAIEDMFLTETTGHYVKVVSQLDGKVDATPGQFEGTLNVDSDNNAPTSKAVATYVTNYVANNAVQTVEAGETNGTIEVDGAPVAVTGLAALAYKGTVGTADIDANAVITAKIADDAVTSAKIDDATITDADIAGNAQIALSKINFSGAQTNALNSGITSGGVTQITSNQTEITRLGGILKPSPECLAADNDNGCTLVVRNGTFSWEAVARAEGEE